MLGRRAPAILIGLRVMLGPVLGWLAVTRAQGGLLVAVLLAGMLSDVFDGVIARRLHVVTRALRMADSLADAWFLGWTGFACWTVASAAIRANSIPIWTFLVLQTIGYSHDLLRYRKIAPLHAYSTKIWGVSLYIAASALLGWHDGRWLWLTFGFGLVSFVDTLAIKMILPGCQFDVGSIRHALELRRAGRFEA